MIIIRRPREEEEVGRCRVWPPIQTAPPSAPPALPPALPGCLRASVPPAASALWSWRVCAVCWCAGRPHRHDRRVTVPIHACIHAVRSSVPTVTSACLPACWLLVHPPRSSCSFSHSVLLPSFPMQATPLPPPSSSCHGGPICAPGVGVCLEQCGLVLGGVYLDLSGGAGPGTDTREPEQVAQLRTRTRTRQAGRQREPGVSPLEAHQQQQQAGG